MLRTYRPWPTIIVYGLLIPPTLAFIVTSVRSTDPDINPASRLLVLGASVGLFAFLVRSIWCSVRVEANGIRVVNLLQSRFFAWTDIEAFTLGPWGMVPRRGIVILRDGSRHGMVAVAAHGRVLGPDRGAQKTISELNQVLLDYRNVEQGRD